MRLATLRLVSLIIICFSLNVCRAQTSAVKQKLDLLQKENNLIDWINERVDFTSKSPEERIAFLMDTQKSAWREANTAAEHYVWLNLLSSQGYYQLVNGNILASINSYETAFAYYRKYKVSNYEIVEYTTKPLSNNYTRLGDYEQALYLQNLALNFLIKTEDKPENIASAYGNIAISYRSMGNLAKAIENINLGLKLVNSHSQSAIMLTNILAGIKFDNKEFLSAEKLIESNIARQKNVNGENAYWLSGSYSIAGDIYMSLNKISAANRSFNKAYVLLNKYFKNSRYREKANVLTSLGSVSLLENQPKRALTYFNQTLKTLKIANTENFVNEAKIYGDNRIVDAFREMAKANLQLNNKAEALKDIKYALLAANKIRDEFADDKTKERLQAEFINITEDGIEVCYGLYAETKNENLLVEILTFAEESKARTLLDGIIRGQQFQSIKMKDTLFAKKQRLERAIVFNEKQEIEENTTAIKKNTAALKFDLALVNKQIKQKYKITSLTAHNLSASQLLSALPKQRIIEYFFGNNSIYLINLKDNKVTGVIKIGDAKSIKQNILNYTNTYFNKGPDAMINNPKAFFDSSYDIFKSLLSKVSFSKDEPIIIVPDGALGYLSLDGLIASDKFSTDIAKWPFLIKNVSITYAFSLQTLVANKPTPTHAGFTGFFITHEKQNSKPLKAVQNEATAIEEAINGKFVFNEKVTTPRFNQAFESSSILHISTHAYLSGKDKEPTIDLGKEKIFLFELASKKHSPSLVVLSACRTADGLLVDGEGILSLARGFSAIGTPATIAGLWNVNDVAASVITGSFYQFLVKDETAGKALHQAKTAWLETPKTANALYLPYYWDSLIYIGIDQKIDLPNHWLTRQVAIVCIGLFLLLLICAAVLLKRRKTSKLLS